MNGVIYRVCKRTIQRGNYPADMQTRLNVFLAAAELTLAEYEELTTMIAA